jgi:protein-S-isoprenylcysteine O-methyltransferase Ste14
MRLENRIPPPVVGLACAGGMWLLARHTPALGVPDAARLGLAIALLAAGVLVMLAGVVSFRMARTTINPLKPETATALVSGGIYRYTRNPMYLGMLLVLLAWAVYLSAPATLIGVVAFWAFIGRFQIPPEEKALAALFGHAFTEYARRVRRWL